MHLFITNLLIVDAPLSLVFFNSFIYIFMRGFDLFLGKDFQREYCVFCAMFYRDCLYIFYKNYFKGKPSYC
jgi:hypothetical protein